MMNPERKAKWIAALRSGKYKQTQCGLLYDEGTGGMCCLAVLLESTGHSVTAQHLGTFDYGCFKELLGGANYRVFTNLNDIKLKSFEEIATYIESAPIL